MDTIHMDYEDYPIGSITGIRFLLPIGVAAEPNAAAAVQMFLKNYEDQGIELKGFTKLSRDGALVVGLTCESDVIDAFIDDEYDLQARISSMQQAFAETVGQLFDARLAKMELLICCESGEYIASMDPPGVVLYEYAEGEW